MSDDIRAAAERLRTAAAFRGGCPWECTAVYTEDHGKPSVRLQYTLDLEIVSYAFLELVPADDDSLPIDKQWWSQVTCSENCWWPIDDFMFGLYFNSVAAHVELVCELEETYTCRRTFAKRSEVRRLLAALGVTK